MPKLFLYEHVSGGGFIDATSPVEILSEGYAMLRSLALDARQAKCHVSTLLDSRLYNLKPPLEVDKMEPVRSLDDLYRKLEKLASEADYSLIIAPEPRGILSSLIRYVSEHSCALNCQPDAVDLVGNKANLYHAFELKGLCFPKTTRIEDDKEVQDAVEELGFPVLLKPLEGVGCERLQLVFNEFDLHKAVADLEFPFLIQEFVMGIHASISLVTTGTECMPLSLNKQVVELNLPGKPSRYLGGQVPLEHPLKQEALEAAKRAVLAFPRLQGYIGVDLVLADKPYVIEVNPRLTTSYVGLRLVASLNTFTIIARSIDGEVPERIGLDGVACFMKLPVDTPTSLMPAPGLLPPPFPFSRPAHALIATRGSTEGEAKAVPRRAWLALR